MTFFSLHEIEPYTPILWFTDFLFSSWKTPYLEIPIFHYWDSLYKNEIHQIYTYLALSTI